jgi:hypothetical protein
MRYICFENKTYPDNKCLGKTTKSIFKMKKQYLLLPALSFCFLLAKAQLNYTQVTSSGLTAVTFEKGRTEIELGDVDGDGDLDIVSIGDHGSPHFSATEQGIMVWKNNGDGTSWSLTKSGDFGYGGVALGDVNNDGKMDIGYAMHHDYSGVDFGNQLIEVALGNGTGSSWTPYDDSLATSGETYGMFGIDFADVNNDGLLDLAANSFGCCSGIHIYKNDGNGHWTQTDGANAGNSMQAVKFGDFNNDGKVDLATANELGFLWSNNGSGFFSSMQAGYTSDWWVEFDIADANNDGAKDVAVIDTAYAAKVYYYDKNQNSWVSISNGLPVYGCTGIAMKDMDGDGNADVVIWQQKAVQIYKGDGTGNWTLAGSIAIAENEYSAMATGDFDHDGYSDIVFLGRDNSLSLNKNMLRVYLHTAAGSGTHGLNILPVNPKGFECFAPGSVQFVNWQSAVPVGPAATVTIEFSSNGNAGPWNTVVANAPNNGTYQWIVPASVNSPNCFLKYTLTAGSSIQSVTNSNAFGVGTCVISPTSVEEQSINTLGFSVYPNPMTTQGYAHFNLERSGNVKIQIVDMLGQVVSTVVNETLSSGSHNPAIPITNLTSGIYFCRIISGDITMNEKIVVAK